jgi:nitrate/TMAO reductase-like tetraheme cytochrome c subunit
VALLVLLVIAAAGLGGAEYYTSRPAFCGTCHVMQSYYNSWSHDAHAVKLDTWCVECHYAPGEQHTIRAKFRGLSQATSYFSGRYGAGRPRAHVTDASCLRSRCHGDEKFLTALRLIGRPRREKRLVGTQETEVTRTPTVKFSHEKHLRVQLRQAENDAQLAAVQERLQQAAGPDTYPRLQALAVSIQPAAQREADARALLKELGRADLAADAAELMHLEHLRARLRQLAGLSCATCHSYDPSGDRHVSLASLETCYTCHFSNQAFNRDTGECLRCHEPPARKIIIHEEAVNAAWRGQNPTTTATAPAGAVLMDHRDIVARKVDCASCHLDVIQGQAPVTARDCTNCHDRAKYLEGFEQRDTEKIAEYHQTHVAAQRARCVDCHRAIQHRLTDAAHVGTSAGFLQPVLSDCRHCHPNHHREQVELLMGTGGTGIARPMPNAMFGSRLNCQACHTKPASDLKGDELVKASQATCVACHNQDYEQLFEQWRNEIGTYLKEAEAALARVDARVTELRDRGEEIPADIAALVSEARVNVQFVRAGNGIHNRSYSLALLDVTTRDLDQVMARLVQP